MKDRTSNAKLKGAKWPEGKTANNGSKPPGPPATGLPVALRKRQLEMLPTTITPQASVLGETGGQSVKRWPRSKYNAITHGIFGPVVLEGAAEAGGGHAERDEHDAEGEAEEEGGAEHADATAALAQLAERNA